MALQCKQHTLYRLHAFLIIMHLGAHVVTHARTPHACKLHRDADVHPCKRMGMGYWMRACLRACSRKCIRPCICQTRQGRYSVFMHLHCFYWSIERYSTLFTFS